MLPAGYCDQVKVNTISQTYHKGLKLALVLSAGYCNQIYCYRLFNVIKNSVIDRLM